MYCYIENSEIIRYNVARPKAIGNTQIGTTATDDDLRDLGFYPVVGEAPAYDQATQRLDGPVYQITAERNVERVYTIIPLTPAEIITKAKEPLEAALENMLDSKARERTWKDCVSARTAAGSPSVFQAEGLAFVKWWEECWVEAHTIMAECIAGTRPIPTVEEFLAEMPELVLP
jgi:hypothetical protein